MAGFFGAASNGMWMTGGQCPVCFGGIAHGQAIFTAECSHTFHLRCIIGNAVCPVPVCGALWRDTLSATPTADDEPVEEAPHAPLGNAAAGLLALKTHCEYPALPMAAARDGFAVLVHAKAPPVSSEAAAARAAIDLVTVLDVSGSMSGEKLALVKRAMGFLVDNLAHGDRLSVVAFSDHGRRVIRLTRMSEEGKAAAKRAVDSLVASGCTNIRDGLDEAAKVLGSRRHRNAVASVILLSDGQDNRSIKKFYVSSSCSHLVPPFFMRTDADRCTPAPTFGFGTGHGAMHGRPLPLFGKPGPTFGFGFGTSQSAAAMNGPPFHVHNTSGDGCGVPVHTFGFGTDHDAAAMHGIAELTGGTFSFIENHAVIQDAFAQCIGGLLSVAVQQARVSLECLHPGVRLRGVKSGRYESRVDAAGRVATVDVGELYADEDRRFLVFVDVPRAAGDETRLLKVSCAYRDAATGRTVDVAGDYAMVLRPVEASDVAPSMEVERERVRVDAAEDMALARAAAERGAYAEAARILDARRDSLARSAPALAGDAMCKALAAELQDLCRRVSDKREYAQTGRACLFAGVSAHAQQRGASVCLSQPFGASAGSSLFSASSVFATPAMRKMEKLSEVAREQQPTPTTTPFGLPTVPERDSNSWSSGGSFLF